MKGKPRDRPQPPGRRLMATVLSAMVVAACHPAQPSSSRVEPQEVDYLLPIASQTGPACVELAAEVGEPIPVAEAVVSMARGEVSILNAEVRSNQPLDTSVDMLVSTDHGEVPITLGAPPDASMVSTQVAPPDETSRSHVTFVQTRDAEPGTTWCLERLHTSAVGTQGAGAAEVLVDQIGYLEGGPRRALLTGVGSKPVDWQLVDSDDVMMARGQSTPLGTDSASGLYLHEIDLTAVEVTGVDLALLASGVRSPAFAMGGDIYSSLLQDPLGMLYGNRSGEPITAAYASGQERPAGHGGDAPNTGDLAVPCLPMDDPAQGLYAEPWSCEGTRDVSGGWYDAGDYGKYVTPGAVAAAQLMHTFETTDFWRQTGVLPGGVEDPMPDLLEEVKVQLDFLLKMQVSDGGTYDGMAYHKVHGTDWVPSGLLPHEDPTQRVLYRPSTQATMALAATTAQASRVFREYDSEYADLLLGASRRAYDAGLREPELYPPAQDESVDPNPGGGAYSDQDAADELFWANAELYLTTGEDKYSDEVWRSEERRGDSPVSDYYWADMEGFAVLQLSRSAEDPALRDHMSERLLKMADSNLQEGQASAWNIPYAPDGRIFAWGSNTIILSRANVMGAAYDLTGDPRYVSGALEAMHFILGLNPTGRSYVTGWGESAVTEPHGALFGEGRSAPPGTLVGGANTRAAATGDQAASEELSGCIGLTCHVDVASSWSTNEPTIYGNAALFSALSLAHEWSATVQGAPEVSDSPSDRDG